MLHVLLGRRCLRLPQRLQHFSSSPLSSDGLSQYVRRVLDRKDQLKRYEDHNVFPPNNWSLHNYYLYAQLQLPSKTEIDAVEFLDGVRFAGDRVIRSMHANQPIDLSSDCQIDTDIEQMFDSLCFQKDFLPRVRRLGVAASSIELKELDFTGVYLAGVSCERTTRFNIKMEEKLRTVLSEMLKEKHRMNQLNGELSVKKVLDDVSAVQQKVESELETSSDDEEEVERLQLTALLRTTQSVEAVSAQTAEKQTVTSDVKTMLRFESLVTEPSDVDWRIIKLKQIGRVTSRTKGN
ncbi:hypothetical protein DVH05_003375 [Phytophthora capsici]|nr:hypothetical protein DVH05_003375 [Phytophthora capsici]|eukprot:jgi/Phyca11/545014/estExt2_Genewise1Plus.C_PHYCAscaffold_160545